MSTKMLTSTSGLTKSCYIDLRSSQCLEASDVNKNVDMSTFSPNRIHVNMQNDCETSIVVANSIQVSRKYISNSPLRITQDVNKYVDMSTFCQQDRKVAEQTWSVSKFQLPTPSIEKVTTILARQRKCFFLYKIKTLGHPLE